MTWLILAQIVVLTVLSVFRGRLECPSRLRRAWIWLVMVFFSQAVFTLFRAGNYRDVDLGLVEIWATGFVWAFLGMSLLQLPTVVLGSGEVRTDK